MQYVQVIFFHLHICMYVCMYINSIYVCTIYLVILFVYIHFQYEQKTKQINKNITIYIVLVSVVVGNDTIIKRPVVWISCSYILISTEFIRALCIYSFIYNAPDAFDHHYNLSNCQTLNYISLRSVLSSERVVIK